jgi:VWFA-related protein
MAGSRWPLLAVGLATVSLALAAQAPAQLEPFRTDVNYVRVDMYPTADDRPVMDLRPDEVEILDEGVPQKIDRFEYVHVSGARSQSERREPSSVAGMREAAQDIRARLFVLFLDMDHVNWGASLNVNSPLIQGLNQMIGGDDLIAVMTPGVHARDLTFSRRTTSIEQLLRTAWGQRDIRVTPDPDETDFMLCYPAAALSDEGIAKEMILRLRETRTLDALEELVQYLRFVREERKTVITITQGWRLYNDNPALRETMKTPVPIVPLGRDPRTGRPGRPVTGRSSDSYEELMQKCEQMRISLSMLQNEPRFLHIMRQANTGNTTFYPMDPRGLAVFDEDIDARVGIIEDSARLKDRHEAMRLMADVTNGLALLNTGNLSSVMQRIVADSSSYYLIGYYSTTQMDGKFHDLTVRVKRPGVLVRARAGYLAATREDFAKARAAASAANAARPLDERLQAVQHSLSALASFSRERPLRLQVAAGYQPSGAAAFYGVAEVPLTAGRHDWSDGGEADVSLLDDRGQTVATERLTIDPGVRSVRFTLGAGASLAAGDYQISIRAKGVSATLAARESVRVSLPAAPAAAGALFVRQGLTTGRQPMPTADLRFRRTDRITIEVRTPSPDAGTAQVLGRAGKPMAIPVTTAMRDAADGSRWRSAQVSLAPLAPGDYLLEQIAGAERTLTAFRVLP